ncbi:uncharacterized protein misp [Nerophis ophidion]|uniref:uncharacterized protein misp n=1 Tax=Nerophis ophidion TaxID=159077 RepID=UPI002AE07717|nr:uncharacterized protein misp [Nerophis ophidion]
MYFIYAGVICSTSPPAAMDNVPRRWALKPLSPLLHPSDPRNLAAPSNGEDHLMATDSLIDSPLQEDEFREMVVQACLVHSSQDGDDSSDLYSGSPGSSSGSHSGFYSFVEDPTSPEAELNEAWMVSPQRQVHLTTLKEDKAFKVQTYNSGRKPESMFSESESQYTLQPEDPCRAFGEEEEKQLRKDIIRTQAPKKKSMSKLSLLEEEDCSTSTNKPTQSFGVSYSAVGLEPCRPVDPETIIREQINFGAARQQFLKLEQNMQNPPVLPSKSSVSWKVEGDDAKRSEPSGKGKTSVDRRTTENDLNDEHFFKEDSLVDEVFPESIQQDRRKVKFRLETPIEQEIRLVQEREENLRHTRGLKHSEGGSELVEIRAKHQSPQTYVKATKKKHVGFIVQEHNPKKNHKQQGRDPPKVFSDTKEDVQNLQDPEVSLSSCCPDETFYTCPSWTRIHSWRDNQESTGLHCGKKGAQNFIEKEIQEALQREQELRQLRESKKSKEFGEYRVNSESGEYGVFGKSREHGQSRVFGVSKVSGEFGESEGFRDSGVSRVFGESREHGESGVSGVPRVSEESGEFQESGVSGESREHGQFRVSGVSKVSGESGVSRVFGESREHGESRVSGVPRVSEESAEFRESGVSGESRKHGQFRVYGVSRVYRESGEFPESGVSGESRGNGESRVSGVPRVYGEFGESGELRESGVSRVFGKSSENGESTVSGVPGESRESKESITPREPGGSCLFSPAPLVVQAPTMTSNQIYLTKNSGSCSSLSSLTTSHAPPPSKGLTETLLRGLEEQRLRLQLDESSYAGIQPVDDINNQVVESTRVIRHKNQRALRWEAGVFANQLDQ